MSLINKLKVVAWNVGFIESSISDLMDGYDYRITWMKHSFHDRFFADPFLLSLDEQYYWILAEEYSFIEGKGKIVKLKVDRDSKELIERILLIETDYHMSYPFIYKNHIYAEQSASGNWIRYELNGENPERISDVGFIDGTLFNDGIHEWLFATKIDLNKSDACRKLYRYEMRKGYPILETEMLVRDDLIASRPGGQFFRWNNEWYRVAQTSSEKVYGEKIAICKVNKCTQEEYDEEIDVEISSEKENRFNKGLHTFNVYDDLIIVDGFELQTHPFQKIKAKIIG